MATKNKTTYTNVNVTDFIHAFVENDQKKSDSFKLVELMREWSGFEREMYGPTLSVWGITTINMLVVMKVTRQLLVFHLVKRRFLYMFIRLMMKMRNFSPNWEHTR